MSNDKILRQVGEYYTGKLAEHGATPKGVDWNSVESQELRFSQLLQIVREPSNPFSMLDYGCGFGSMLGFMQQHYKNFTFAGYDISEAMIAEANQKYPGSEWFAKLPPKPYEYVVASGIFNVRLENTDEAWLAYILETLNTMNSLSTKGFSFNVLTSYSDKEFMKDYLYYADARVLLDHCKKHFSKYVAILHDYPLYEFTVLVRKDV